MQITRFLSLNEAQFLGCVSAFSDSLTGELNAALTYLRRLEGERKGSAFAFEMKLDQHRYGALIVLERWADLTRAFAGHTELGTHQEMFDSAAPRVEAARNVLERANHVVDAADHYGPEIVEACRAAFDTAAMTFRQEQEAAAKAASLGPMQPEEFREYRRVFLGDLGAR
ncbi:MAG: hypothetical protein IT165_33630 [Bryobacterales bacterium]|nr:hypothetical protein [Bryobacterales bacterium]